MVVPVLDAEFVPEAPPPPAKKVGHRFEPGHKKVPGSGRRRQTVFPTAFQICRTNKIDPLGALLRVYKTGVLTDPDGTEHKIDYRSRLKILLRVLEYCHPKLSGPISGAIDHRHVHLDLSRIMSNPDLALAAENLAIAMAEQPDEP